MPDLEALKQEEAELATALLPEDPGEVRELTSREKLQTKAYLVLACALIEDFFERCFAAYIDGAIGSHEGRIDPSFIPLATKFAGDLIGQAHKLLPAVDAMPKLAGLYKAKVVHPNNGIKRKNLETMAKPLGLNERLEDECEGLLGPADTLGARRGTLAHAPHVIEEIRPVQARQAVTDVIDQIPGLQKLLKAQASE